MVSMKNNKQLVTINKLNNNGLTLIELILCFLIVSVIVISLLNTVMNYKNKEQIEDLRSNIISYKNQVTRIIETDFIKNDISSYKLVSTSGKAGESSTEIWDITFQFNKQFCGGIYQKNMKIVRGNKENYIMYPDIFERGGTCYNQNVKYDLLSTTNVLDVDVNDATTASGDKVEYSDIRFAYVYLKAYGNIFTLDIPIYHSDFGTNYHIRIISPLNYLQSAKS